MTQRSSRITAMKTTSRCLRLEIVFFGGGAGRYTKTKWFFELFQCTQIEHQLLPHLHFLVHPIVKY